MKRVRSRRTKDGEMGERRGKGGGRQKAVRELRSSQRRLRRALMLRLEGRPGGHQSIKVDTRRFFTVVCSAFAYLHFHPTCL